MKVATGLLQIFLVCIFWWPDEARSLTSIEKVELIRKTPKHVVVGLPHNAPRPVFYFLPGATAPSCGLVAGRGNAITPILEIEPPETFPQCLDITEGAEFRHGGFAGYVFKYLQRDTREDTSTAYFFVKQFENKLQPLDLLNQAKPPQNRPISYLAAWGKSKLLTRRNEIKGYRDTPHSIILASAILNVSRNEKASKCRTEVDLVTTERLLPVQVNSCRSILASTSISSKEGVYFVVLIEDTRKRILGQILQATSDKVRRATELEERFKVEIESGEILNLKRSIRRMLEEERGRSEYSSP